MKPVLIQVNCNDDYFEKREKEKKREEREEMGGQ